MCYFPSQAHIKGSKNSCWVEGTHIRKTSLKTIQLWPFLCLALVLSSSNIGSCQKRADSFWGELWVSHPSQWRSQLPTLVSPVAVLKYIERASPLCQMQPASLLRCPPGCSLGATWLQWDSHLWLRAPAGNQVCRAKGSGFWGTTFLGPLDQEEGETREAGYTSANHLASLCLSFLIC